MTWFIPILTKDNKTIYIATSKIRYIEDLNPERRIHCHSGHMLFINTPMRLEQLSQQLTSTEPPMKLVSYIGERGHPSLLNVTYIAHVEANKKGDAEIHCHYADNRHVIKTQTPLNQFLTHLEEAGARMIGT